jgi:hypothetical protein
MNTDYNGTFFEWVNLTARRSALAVVPLTKYEVRPSSVLDVGCGQGAWLALWFRACSKSDIVGWWQLRAAGDDKSIACPTA